MAKITKTGLLRHYRRLIGWEPFTENRRVMDAIFAAYNLRLSGTKTMYRSLKTVIVALLNDGVPHVEIVHGERPTRIHVMSMPDLEDPTTPDFWGAVQWIQRLDDAAIEARLAVAPGWTLEQMLVLAEQLDLMQRGLNEGRGVTHVRDIIALLRRGDLQNARVVAVYDGHKFRMNEGAYENIRQVVGKELFRGVKELPVYYEDLRR